VLLFFALLRARIAREEVLLEQHFGDEFRRYRGRTGGLLPRFGFGGGS
jgi:protein-S-isoprenylcysteine O-methyltransferase Ste14